MGRKLRAKLKRALNRLRCEMIWLWFSLTYNQRNPIHAHS